jgi:hypothetical protein
VASSLRRSAEVLSARIGAHAEYASFAPPTVTKAHSHAPRGRLPVLRFLWLASLVLFVVVVILAALVGLGL